MNDTILTMSTLSDKHSESGKMLPVQKAINIDIPSSYSYLFKREW